jgi:hypothetical protein
MTLESRLFTRCVQRVDSFASDETPPSALVLDPTVRDRIMLPTARMQPPIFVPHERAVVPASARFKEYPTVAPPPSHFTGNFILRHPLILIIPKSTIGVDATCHGTCQPLLDLQNTSREGLSMCRSTGRPCHTITYFQPYTDLCNPRRFPNSLPCRKRPWWRSNLAHLGLRMNSRVGALHFRRMHSETSNGRTVIVGAKPKRFCPRGGLRRLNSCNRICSLSGNSHIMFLSRRVNSRTRTIAFRHLFSSNSMLFTRQFQWKRILRPLNGCSRCPDRTRSSAEETHSIRLLFLLESLRSCPRLPLSRHYVVRLRLPLRLPNRPTDYRQHNTTRCSRTCSMFPPSLRRR